MKRYIRVANTVYELFQARWSVLCRGFIRYEDGERIVVRNDRFEGHDPDETLFHEIFHACERELVRKGRIPNESTENYVEGMSSLLYAALRNNGFLRMDVEWGQLNIRGMEPDDPNANPLREL